MDVPDMITLSSAMVQDDDAPLLLTQSDAAKKLGVSRDTLRSLVEDGLIAFVRIGSSKRIYHSDLVDFIEANRCRSIKEKTEIGSSDSIGEMARAVSKRSKRKTTRASGTSRPWNKGSKQKTQPKRRANIHSLT